MPYCVRMGSKMSARGAENACKGKYTCERENGCKRLILSRGKCAKKKSRTEYAAGIEQKKKSVQI